MERPVDGHGAREVGGANFDVHKTTVWPMNLWRDILCVSTGAFGLWCGRWV